MTMLHFDSTVYGPVHSRRFGSSLGVNLLPPEGKLCNFDCIYCECGWNRDNVTGGRFPSPEEFGRSLKTALEHVSENGIHVDSITFSGNGEPTLNPCFPETVGIACSLRDALAPSAKITVLSNATTCGRPEILEALKKADNPVMKIDAAAPQFVPMISRPSGNYDLDRVVSDLEAFNGNFVLQTMFLRSGTFDTADPANLEAWYGIVRKLKPREIMAYSIARETPQKGLHGYSADEIRRFVQPLADEGFSIMVTA